VNDYFMSINLIDMVYFMAFFGGVFISKKVSERTKKPFLRIFFGLERKEIIESTTKSEKIFLVSLIVIFILLSYLGSHNIKTISDFTVNLF